MQSYKNLGLIGLVILIAVGGIGLYFFEDIIRTSLTRSTNTPIQDATEKVSLVNAPQNISSLDTDSDGLKDWEEALWGTDPKKQDTDDDGTDDGDEVKAGRNPMKKGPDDKMAEIVKATDGDNETTNAEPTLTDELSRALFTQFMLAKQNGITVDQNTATQIATQEFNNIVQVNSVFNYTNKDLKITDANDATTLRVYGNALGTAILSGGNSNKTESELDIYDKLIKTRDQSFVPQIVAIADSYQHVIDELKNITVPRSASAAHLDLLNSMSGVQNGIALMSEQLSDELAGPLGLLIYEKQATNMITAMRGLQNFFSKNGISFSTNEPGRVITNTI